MRKARTAKCKETVDGHERAKDYLSEDEVEQMLSAARVGRHGDRDYLLILLMFRHGLRISEALALRVKDLDLKRARIWIERSKGGLSTEQPLDGRELRAIRRYLASRRNSLPWLFTSERGGQMVRQAANYLIAQIGERAGLGHVHPHMLRHSTGFALANRGHDTRILQDLLGHRDPRHTSRYTRTASVRFERLWR